MISNSTPLQLSPRGILLGWRITSFEDHHVLSTMSSVQFPQAENIRLQQLTIHTYIHTYISGMCAARVCLYFDNNWVFLMSMKQMLKDYIVHLFSLIFYCHVLFECGANMVSVVWTLRQNTIKRWCREEWHRSPFVEKTAKQLWPLCCGEASGPSI